MMRYRANLRGIKKSHACPDGAVTSYLGEQSHAHPDGTTTHNHESSSILDIVQLGVTHKDLLVTKTDPKVVCYTKEYSEILEQPPQSLTGLADPLYQRAYCHWPT